MKHGRLICTHEARDFFGNSPSQWAVLCWTPRRSAHRTRSFGGSLGLGVTVSDQMTDDHLSLLDELSFCEGWKNDFKILSSCMFEKMAACSIPSRMMMVVCEDVQGPLGKATFGRSASRDPKSPYLRVVPSWSGIPRRLRG